MKIPKVKLPSKKYLIMIAILSLVLISAVGVEIHKSTLLMPGQLSAKAYKGEEIQGFVSHAELETECSHCHAPIHCVKDSKCQDCHIEVAQQRAELRGLHGRLPGISQCENCHPEHQGREAYITYFAYSNINHTLLANFSLALHQFDYDNQPMGCHSCHSQDRYISETMDCITCHVSEDHDGMASHIDTFSTDCVACHDGVDRYSNFKHADFYPLDGEHQDVECEACHQEKQYAGTPQDCASCHQGKMFVDIFGHSCEHCHDVTAWTPARLKLHTFVVDHGVDVSPTCETCHIHTYLEYTCSNCHDLVEMETVHLEKDIEGIDDCIECHTTGDADELLQIKGKNTYHDDLELVNRKWKSRSSTVLSTLERQSIAMNQLKGGSSITI